MKKLLLSSNGTFAIEKGIKLFFEDVSKIKLAYIMTAGKASRDKTYLGKHKQELKGLGCKFEVLDIEGKSEAELRKLLADKDAVYVEGGNTFYPLKAVRESRFDTVMKELIAKGVV